MQGRPLLVGVTIVLGVALFSYCGGDEVSPIGVDTRSSTVVVPMTQGIAAEEVAVQSQPGSKERTRNVSPVSSDLERETMATVPGVAMKCKKKGSHCLGPLDCCSWRCGIFSFKCE